MNYRKVIIDDIKKGNNIDLYVTVVLAITVTALNVIGFTLVNKNVPPLTLSLLALISFSLLISRHQIEKVVQKVMGHKDAVIVDDFDYVRLAEDMEICDELMLQGVSLLSHFQNNLDLFQNKIKKGQKISVLLVNKDSPSLKIAADRDQVSNPIYQQSRIDQTLDYLKELKREGANIVAKIIDSPLDFETVVCTNGNKKNLYLRHYGFKTQSGTEPKIVITQDNQALFSYFTDHLTNLWKSGKDLDLNLQNPL
ncbi:MAG: hypothetical protein QM737_08020 [Ferruginibacter sp.]